MAELRLPPPFAGRRLLGSAAAARAAGNAASHLDEVAAHVDDAAGAATTASRPLSTPFQDEALRSQVDDVVRYFDDFSEPPPGVAQGGLTGHPPGTYGGQGLPPQPLGYYTEMDVWPSAGVGTGTRGAERIVIGKGGEVYYTPNHYEDFVRLR